MSALVLAGGLATRMGKLCKNDSKGMLPVAGHPFLYWIVKGLTSFDLSVTITHSPHNADIRLYFEKSDWQRRGVTLFCTPPDGTGPAIRDAMETISTPSFIVLNADTAFTRMRIKQAMAFHGGHSCPITQVLATHSNQNQGLIEVANGFVVATHESSNQQKCGSYDGFSNSGIYVLDREFVISDFQSHLKSFEQELLPQFMLGGLVRAWIEDMDVYDFGTPERYRSLLMTATQLETMFI